MTEIWRDIKDYEGLYQVSNWGRVKSLKFGRERVLQPEKNNRGYFIVGLCKNGKRKMLSVHRLIATAFLDNPDNLPCVNHKDENQSNNFVGTSENDYKDGNLEWCSYEYNNNYGSHKERVAKSQSKTVFQFTKTGDFVREWSSTAECGRNGFNRGHVAACCRGNTRLKTYKGFIWKYKETL